MASDQQALDDETADGSLAPGEAPEVAAGGVIAETVDGHPVAVEPGPEAEPEADAEAARPAAEPVRAAERVASVDVIRGVALCGILAMNIAGFAWPGQVYSVPIAAEGAGWASTAIWAFNRLVFDTKMMTLFSMLFGAGLVLMADRADGRGAKIRGVYYRRVLWLLVIGLVHAYLIWDGDVLVLYASCGFVLYPFRRLSPRALIVLGIALNLLLVPLLLGFRFAGLPYMERTAAEARRVREAGGEPTWWQGKVGKAYEQMTKREKPKREDFLRSMGRRRAGYVAIVKDRAPGLLMEQTIGFVLGGIWLVGGRMLLGMGLMKLGVFSASRSTRTYLAMMALGYGIGLPLIAFDIWHLVAHDFFLDSGLDYALAGWPFLNFYGSLPVVFGHIGLVMLVCKSGAIPWLTRRLAAVGRMALSNYLTQSIVCTTLFYGYGFDLFGTIHRPLLLAIVATIWTAQLLVSPLWLEHFRYGPAEWLWRSLTYWKLQPMRVAAPSA